MERNPTGVYNYENVITIVSQGIMNLADKREKKFKKLIDELGEKDNDGNIVYKNGIVKFKDDYDTNFIKKELEKIDEKYINLNNIINFTNKLFVPTKQYAIEMSKKVIESIKELCIENKKDPEQYIAYIVESLDDSLIKKTIKQYPSTKTVSKIKNKDYKNIYFWVLIVFYLEFK